MTLAFNEKVEAVRLTQKAKPNFVFTRHILSNAKAGTANNDDRDLRPRHQRKKGIIL